MALPSTAAASDAGSLGFPARDGFACRDAMTTRSASFIDSEEFEGSSQVDSFAYQFDISMVDASILDAEEQLMVLEALIQDDTRSNAEKCRECMMLMSRFEELAAETLTISCRQEEGAMEMFHVVLGQVDRFRPTMERCCLNRSAPAAASCSSDMATSNASANQLLCIDSDEPSSHAATRQSQLKATAKVASHALPTKECRELTTKNNFRGAASKDGRDAEFLAQVQWGLSFAVELLSAFDPLDTLEEHARWAVLPEAWSKPPSAAREISVGGSSNLHSSVMTDDVAL